MKQQRMAHLKVLCSAVLLVLAACLAYGQDAPAETAPAETASAEPQGYYFFGSQDPLLYPDAAYELNPSVLSRLSATPLAVGIGVDFAQESSTLTRLDDSVGDVGGTYTALDQLLDAAFSVEKVFRFGAEGSSTLAVSLDAALDWENAQEQYQDYNSFSEYITTTTQTAPFTVGTEVVYALKLAALPMPLGVSVGYSFSLNPAEFTLATDQTVSSVSYVTDTVQANDIFRHAWETTLAAALPLTTIGEVDVAVRYAGGYTDGATSYIAVDTDADGRYETIMTAAAYYPYTGDGGPTETAKTYDAKDQTVSTAVYLTPALRLFVSDAVELLADGTYRILDRSRRSYWEHIVLVSDPVADYSENIEVCESGLTSFDALAGAALTGKTGSRLRTGVGFSREDSRFSQDGTGVAQDSYKYSTLNKNKYTELELGTDPVNGSIADADAMVAPTRDITQGLYLLVDLLHKPAAGVGMFLSARVGGSISERTYNAYNLDTRSVWTETVKSQGIDWTISPVAGVYFPLGKKATCVVDLTGGNVDGSVRETTETAPSNSTLGTSGDGTIDLSSSEPMTFAVSVRVVLNY